MGGKITCSLCTKSTGHLWRPHRFIKITGVLLLPLIGCTVEAPAPPRTALPQEVIRAKARHQTQETFVIRMRFRRTLQSQSLTGKYVRSFDPHRRTGDALRNRHALVSGGRHSQTGHQTPAPQSHGPDVLETTERVFVPHRHVLRGPRRSDVPVASSQRLHRS